MQKHTIQKKLNECPTNCTNESIIIKKQQQHEVCGMYIVSVSEEFFKQCGGVSVVTVETTLHG
jgi:hypothetical protein